MISAVLLDRDGVIIEDRADFVKTWDELVFIPAAFKAILKLTQAGLPIVVITNQSAVGRGIVTREFVEETHRRMISEIARHGGSISCVYFCPHHPDDGCDCRKPKPGLLEKAAHDLEFKASDTIMVGDSVRDIEAAAAVGGRGVLVRTGKGQQEAGKLSSSQASRACVAVVDDIAAAADLIIGMVHA